MTDSTSKKLHPNNVHNQAYDFTALIQSEPRLAPFVRPSKYGNRSVDFADPKAVLMLNTALLKHFYGITFYELPKGFLIPPIPGRADYIHYMADLIQATVNGKDAKTAKIRALDIGVGANCIYPIIGQSIYGWDVVGAEVDPLAFAAARKIVDSNEKLSSSIELRFQNDPDHFFTGIIKKDEKFDLTLCNPPFHKSQEDALKGTRRKIKNLTQKNAAKTTLNFEGQANELWYPGGEIAFITKMIKESSKFTRNVRWFSSLVSKKENLDVIYKVLKEVQAQKVTTIEMQQGQKVTRIIAWSFQQTPDKALS